MGGEAEEAVEVHGASEVLDGKDGDDAGDGLFCHYVHLPVAMTMGCDYFIQATTSDSGFSEDRLARSQITAILIV
jgi:hypothetical protein